MYVELFSTGGVDNETSMVKTELITEVNKGDEKVNATQEDDLEIDEAKRTQLIKYGIIPRKRKRSGLSGFSKR